jgi:hypothetical protein
MHAGCVLFVVMDSCCVKNITNNVAWLSCRLYTLLLLLLLLSPEHSIA